MKVRVAVYNVKKITILIIDLLKLILLNTKMFGVFGAIFVLIKCFDWCMCSCGRGKDDANYIL